MKRPLCSYEEYTITNIVISLFSPRLPDKYMISVKYQVIQIQHE